MEKQKTFTLLKEYLIFGGYPRIVTETKREEKLLLINEIFESYLMKDIVYLLKINHPEIFSRLINILANYTGFHINYSTLASDIGVSVQTLKKYLWYSEKTYIIKMITPYYKNKRKEIKKSQTVYFNDIGLRNFALNNYGNDAIYNHPSFLFQNFIFMLLRDIQKNNNYKIQYWRTADKAVVDFILCSGNLVIPLEVKFSKLKKPDIPRSFKSFLNKYKPSKGYIVNLDFTEEMKVEQTNVKFIPFYKLYDELL